MRPKVKKVWRVKFMTSTDNKGGITGELYTKSKGAAKELAHFLTNDAFSACADTAAIDCLPVCCSKEEKPVSWVTRMVKRFS